MNAKNGDARGVRLLGYWEPPDGAGAPIGCVATTFTFDGPFFEEHCLGRFAGIDSDPVENRRAYLIEREEKLAQLYSCILVDRSHVTPLRSLRWNLLPVNVPGGGILHSKLVLLVWERHVRVLVSSANLTEPGYRSNYEQMAVLEFTPEGSMPLGLLADAVKHLDRIRSHVPGRRDGAGPTRGLAEFLGRVRRHVSSWPDRGWAPGAVRAELVCVHPGGQGLLEQLIERAWTGTGPDEVHVLSPFFDQGDGVRDVLDRLLAIMSVQGERTIRFFVSGRRLPDGVVELDLPDACREPVAKRVVHSFELVRDRDEAGNARGLHAKSLWLQRNDRAICTVGSSNFTAAGTGGGGATTNLEANVAYALPAGSSRSDWAKVADCWPESDELDLDSDEVRFLVGALDRTPEVIAYDLLPAAFGPALFRPSANDANLELTIAHGAPAEFRVLDLEGREILSEREWAAAGSPETVVESWSETRPPSALLVEWPSDHGVVRRAVWVVNVTDGALLAPPSELLHLTLEELIEVLTSARPLQVAVGQVLDRRETHAAATPGVVVDPHRKVDTSNFLLRRVRRVSQALEGMRERLERPAFTRDALVWRLHGPIGPLVMARKLAEQEGQGAAFMIAEVALTLKHADLSALERSLGEDFVRTSVADVQAKLAELAKAHPAPANLARYVGECLAELGS